MLNLVYYSECLKTKNVFYALEKTRLKNMYIFIWSCVELTVQSKSFVACCNLNSGSAFEHNILDVKLQLSDLEAAESGEQV